MKYEIMKDWRWSIEVDMNEDYQKTYKLVIPTLGYAFGGSRYDKDFTNKRFKWHDATSYVGEILNYNLISTLLLNSYINSSIKRDFFTQLGIDGLKNSLTWQKDYVFPKPGNVFLKSSYCGIVIDVDSPSNTIKILGFNRLMPFIEGFVEETFALNSTNKMWNRVYSTHRVDEFDYFIGETNRDNNKHLSRPDPMYFFEIIRDIREI